MSYNKQTWTDGDVITAEKLNHIEDGIDSSEEDILEIRFDNTTKECNYTFEEVLAAHNAGKLLRAFVHDASMGGTLDFTLNDYKIMGMYGTIQSIEFGYIDAVRYYKFTLSSSGNKSLVTGVLSQSS